VILLDSTVPMYLVGAEHLHKHDVQRLLDSAITRGDRLVTDAEVLQEILHRYLGIHRPEAIEPAFDAILGLVDDVLPIDLGVVKQAKRIVLGSYGLSSRDAVHVAVMLNAGIRRIMTFDAGFDAYPGLERLH
jgi:predicted nucleic acid-binding protein